MNPALEIIAHRGASHDAPENTLAAVKLGWSQNADAVEIDVHVTLDGVAVAIHDPTLLRTTGRDARVDALSLTDIRKLDAGIWKSGEWRGERVPTLAEVLKTIPAGKRLFIELKDTPGLVPAVRAAVDSAGASAASLVLISFEAAALRDAKRALPGSPVFFLADTPDCTPARIEELIRFCQAEGFGGLDVSAGWTIDAALVRRLHAAGLELHVWTVNDPARANRLAAVGVDGITTDRPGWLRGRLSSAAR